MECNCNNNSNNGGVIPWVRGNRLPLIICVYEDVVTQEGEGSLVHNKMERVPYEIQAADTVTVVMKSGFRQVEMPFTTDGNKVMVTDNGELPTGAYTVEVTIERGDGARGRWQETRQVRIYENTSDAQLGEMYSIDADLFFFAKGDTGVGIADITPNQDNTLTITMTDGTTYTTEAVKGDKGDKGDTGERGTSIVSFDVTGQTDVSVIYTVTFSDDTTQEVAVPKGPQGDTGLTGNGIASTTLNSDYTLTIAYTDGTTYTTPSIRGAQGAQGVSVIGFTQTGETATNTMYNLVFSDGRTQSVAIPKGAKGAKGDTGNPGPQGAQGPKGDTVTATDYTLYNTQGSSSEGAMSQDATTKAISAQTGYYTCGTAEGTAEKVVTVESGNLYKRTLGGHFKVKMTNKNTAASGVTLQIGSETAAALWYNGAAASASNSWDAGEVISVYYDGTYYQASNAQGGSAMGKKRLYGRSGYNTVLNVGIGNTVGAATADPPVVTYEQKVNEGDVICITAQGANAGRCWGFIDSDRTLLAVEDAGVFCNNKVLVVPAGVDKVVFDALVTDISGIKGYPDYEWYYAKAGSTAAEAMLSQHAEYIKYDNSVSGLTAENVQGAVDEMSQVIDGAVQKEVYKEINNSNYVNYGEKYIQYSTGAIKGSGNYISYKISNSNYKRIIARLGDNDTNDGIIAFYNTSEPSTEGYMKNYSLASNGSYRDVDISIPEGCLCIIVSYRKTYTESYFKVYETIMVTNVTSGNYKQLVVTDKTLSEIDTPADANAVGAVLRGVPNYTVSGNTCNTKELIPVVGGSTIYWTSGVSDQSLQLRVYNSSKELIDGWKATSSTRVFTLIAKSAYVDCPFIYGTIGAGIKDNNGNVLFAPTDTSGKLIPEIDDTLKVAGAAADSKAAGDKISALSFELQTSILWGKSITRYGNIIDRESTFVTDFIPVTTEQITWMYGEASSANYGDNSSLCMYDENKVLYDYCIPFIISGGTGRVFTPARKGYVRATFYNVNLDDRVITKTTKGDVFKIPLAETINILSKEVANMNVAPSVIQTQVIGHGQDVRDGYPKDSMPLFRHLYYDKGLKFLEVDVQVTSDGIAVCSHDTTINAEARNPDGSTISGTITISQHTYEELNQYDYGIKRGEQFRGLGLLKFEDFIIFCKRRNVLVWVDKAMGNNSIINAAYNVLSSQGYFWNVFWESVSAVYPRINPIINVSSTSEIDNVIKANYTGKNRIGVMFGQNSTAYSTIKPLANYAYKMNVSSFAFTYTGSEVVSNLMDAGVQGIIAEGVTNDVI